MAEDSYNHQRNILEIFVHFDHFRCPRFGSGVIFPGHQFLAFLILFDRPTNMEIPVDGSQCFTTLEPFMTKTKQKSNFISFYSIDYTIQ